MSYAAEDFEAVKERILSEFATKGFGAKALTFKEALELREYAKGQTDLHSENPTTAQAIWKSLYEGLTRRTRKASPDSMAGIEALEKRRDNLQNLQKMIAAKTESQLLVGWRLFSEVWLILLSGLSFGIAGTIFCIFAIDSAEAQSKIAIFLSRRLGEKRISAWLYDRALTIR